MITQELSDADLLSLFRSGNRDAFEVLYNRYWKLLYQLGTRIVESDEIAKDIVQEIFVDIFERDTGRVENVRAYLLQAVKYRCFMHLRAGKISAKHIERLNTVVAANVIEEEMMADELQAALEERIASLPDKCREVFCLSRFEFESNKKIAERLNI
ncbi:MAG TPA: sigma-70 family RNA polymerase sigma factor [Chryseosolibacter sp.]|nr:sigma-70 family RNA polymerase sigma factor [Chryseosolibacter sp.]